METQPAVVEYFRSLELALNEHKEKGTPKGDPTYSSRMYTQLARDLAQLGIGRDGIPETAKSCGHVSTFERLDQHHEETCRLTEDDVAFSSEGPSSEL